MTEIASRLLATFETLTPDEQHAVVAQMLRRTGALPTTPLDDDGLVAVAEELFQTLDTEEIDGDSSNPR